MGFMVLNLKPTHKKKRLEIISRRFFYIVTFSLLMFSIFLNQINIYWKVITITA